MNFKRVTLDEHLVKQRAGQGERRESRSLTHDAMVAVGGGRWRCVRCGREGTIAEVNAVECPNRVATQAERDQNLIDAIEGKFDVRDVKTNKESIK